MTLTLPGTVPSKKNSKRRVMRGAHVFMIPSERHEAWHEEMMWRVKPHIPKTPIERAALSIVFYVPDNRARDLTNMAESVADLLVDAGILKDDAWQVVGPITLDCGGISKNAPRAEVTIEQV